MARQTLPPEDDFPRLLRSRSEVAAQIDRQIAAQKDVWKRAFGTVAEFEEAKAAFRSWFEYTYDYLRKAIAPRAIAAEFRGSFAGFITHTDYDSDEAVDDFKKETRNVMVKLQSIRERLELFEDPKAEGQPKDIERSRRVFVVHGRDDYLKVETARLLEGIGLQPVILHEQANRGRTIIEKFEDHADVGFAIALLTPDDLGCLQPPVGETPKLEPRARQNVLFEMGFFSGKLGRDRVLALYKGGVELPSDYAGVIYTKVDAGGAWKLEVARELQAAGYTVKLDGIR